MHVFFCCVLTLDNEATINN